MLWQQSWPCWCAHLNLGALPEAAARAGAGAGAAETGSLGWQTTLLSMVPILA